MINCSHLQNTARAAAPAGVLARALSPGQGRTHHRPLGEPRESEEA